MRSLSFTAVLAAIGLFGPATGVALADGVISGTVTDVSTGNSAPGINVYLFDASDNFVAETATASDGTYALASEPAGSYEVEFAGGAYLPQFYNDKASFATATPVMVGSGNVTGINAAMEAGGQISGTVTDALSSAAVANVEVDVYATNSSGSTPVDTVCTAADGTYTVAGLATGSYYVGFTDGCGALNYAPQFYNGKSSLASADAVSVTAGTTTGSVDAAMAAGGQVSGTVTDALSSAAVANVEVDVYASNSSLSTPVDTVCTASDGTYTVAGLATGSYYVGFNDGCGALNYAPQFYNGKSSLVSSDAVSVTAGSTTSSINAAMQAGGQISGTVTDATSSSPVQNVEVDVYTSTSSGSTPVDTVCTASDGTYAVSGLATGSYYVGFTDGCGALNYAPQFYNGKSSLASADAVSVTAGSTTSAINAAMQAEGQISGTVTDALSSAAVANVEVDVYASNSSLSTPVDTVCTASDGTYTVAGLATGSYYVGFNDGCGASNYQPQFYNGKSSLVSSDAVSVTAGSTTSSINAAMQAEGQISGTVTDALSSAAVANVEVDVYASNSSLSTPVDTVCTASDGTYTVSGLATGSYYVGFNDGCGASNYQPQFYNEKSSLAGSDVVSVTAGSTTSAINAAMQAGGQISGTVTDATSSSPVANVEVDVYATNSSGSTPVDTVCTASDGTYTVSGLATGSYYVGFAVHPSLCGPSNYLPQFYNGKSSLVSSDAVSVTAGSTTSSINAAMQVGGQISGTVTDAASASPAGNVEVDVYASNGSGATPVKVACTSNAGRYTIAALPVGSYYVGFNEGNAGLCSATAYQPQFYNGKSSLASSDVVSVTAGSTTSSIDAAMQVGGQISGTVTDATSSSPVQNVEVDVYTSTSSGSTPADTVCTASDGTYTVSGLATGSYYVGFKSGCGASNYAPQFYNGKSSLAGSDVVSVTAGSTTSSIDAAMQAGGQISGTVTDATSSSPVQNVEVDVYTSTSSGSTPADTVCTASDGTYTVSGLATGSYYVGFKSGCGASNYAPQFYNGKSSLAGSDVVSVTAGSTTSSIDAAMQAGGQISGTVTDATSSSPVQNVEVDVYTSTSSGSTPADTVCTASDGTYTVSGLASGSYYVGFAVHPSLCGPSNYVPQFYNGKSSLVSSDAVSVTAGSTTSSINAAMQVGGQISGTVTDAASASPAGNVEVDVYASNGSGATPVKVACTSNAGRYTIAALPVGSYYVGFNEGNAGLCSATAYQPQFYNGKLSLASSDVVSVTAGLTTSSINAAMLGKTVTVSLAGAGSGSVSGGGINCPGTCSANETPSAPVTLTAVAAAGSSFAGWSGSCSGTGSCVLTMSSDQSVTATFTTNPPVQDSTSTGVSCSPASVSVANATTCTATVTDTASSGATTATGSVGFTASPTTASLGSTANCTLAATSTAGVASCQITFTPSADGSYTITGSYGGDSTHHTSQGSGSLTATTTTPPLPGPGSITIGGTAKVSPKGVVGVPISCTGSTGASCTGKLTLTAVVKTKVKRKVHGRTKTITRTKTVTLGSASFSLAAGSSTALKITVSKANLKLFNKAGHKLKAKAAAELSSGVTITKTITLT